MKFTRSVLVIHNIAHQVLPLFILIVNVCLYFYVSLMRRYVFVWVALPKKKVGVKLLV